MGLLTPKPLPIVKFNKQFLDSASKDERSCVLLASIQSLKEELISRKVKIAYEQSIDNIEDQGGKIIINVKKMSIPADFLIFCSSPHFVIEQARKARGEEVPMSKDPINLSTSISDYFTSFKEIEPFECSHVLLSFEKKFWRSSSDSVMLLGEEYKPFFMLIDLSEFSGLPQKNKILVYLRPGHIDNIHSAFDTSLKASIFKVISQ